MSDPFGEDEVDFDIECMLTGAYTSSLACLRDTRLPLGARLQRGLKNPIDGVGNPDALKGSRPSSPLPAWATPQVWGQGLASFADGALDSVSSLDKAIDSVASPMKSVGEAVGGNLGDDGQPPSPHPTHTPTAEAKDGSHKFHSGMKKADSPARKTIYSLPPGGSPTAEKVDRSSREQCALGTPKPVADLGKGLGEAGRGLLDGVSKGVPSIFGQSEAKAAARSGKAGADMV